MKNYFKQGQEVWYLDDENKIHRGVVSEIRSKQIFKVYVKFEHFNGQFTLDGQEQEKGHICLFQSKPMITENVPIFEERPAYFWSSANVWLYDIITGIDDQGRGQIKGQKSWYIKWQYEKPELI